MAKAPVVEESEFNRAVKVASITGQAKERDVALLQVAYGTGMMPIELARLVVGDYLAPDGSVLVDSQIRAEIAFNGLARPLYWTNKAVVAALGNYMSARVKAGHSIEQSSPLFLTYDGHPFTFTHRTTKTGKDSYSCESLTQIIRRLHAQAGIEGGSALSARRTFGIWLKRKGYDVRHIQELLGVQSLTAVKRRVDADPVRLGAIVSRIMR